LMMLAFLLDQVQQKCNPLFLEAWQHKGSKCALWEALRQLFTSFEVGATANSTSVFPRFERKGAVFEELVAMRRS
jgi:hypothetical protein